MKHQLYMMITAGLLGANVSGWANPSGPETKASVTSPDQELLGNTLQDTMKVNLPFRQVAKEDLMSGISVVDMEDLIQKDYSTYSLDNLSAFVSGYTGNVWGQDGVLVLVDGVPRDANNILPTEISQITVLKSASAVALYGSRAAKGAVLITTKRSHTDGLQIHVRGNASVYTPKSYPKYLGAAEYMTLYNEARANDGLDPFYSDEQIYNTSTHQNIYKYPDINFFSSDYLKKSYQRYDATAEFEGGGRFAHFYTNVNFYNVGDLIKFGEGKKNHTNRLSVRGNVDFHLSDEVNGWIDASATFYDVRGDNSNFWASSATLRPERLTPLIPIDMIDPLDKNSLNLAAASGNIIDGKYLLGGSQENPTNPFAGMYAGGYNKYTSRQFQFDMGVDIDLHKLLKGLKFRTMMAVDYNNGYTTSLNPTYATYEATWTNYNGQDMISGLTSYGKDSSTGTLNASGSATTQTIYFSGQLSYDHTFAKTHHFGAILLANGYQQRVSGTYHRTSNANLGLDLNYDYCGRYYADFAMAAVHSAKLAPGHREALSPSLSLAWRIDREPWMERAKGWLDVLKINASVANLNQDIDISDYYMYDDVFTATGTWWGWSETSTAMQTSDSKRAANYDLTFVKRKELTVGLDASLWKGLVKLQANYFLTNTNGLLTTAGNLYPSYFDIDKPGRPVSSFLPYINYNNVRRTGFDFAVDLHKKFGEVDLQLGVNGMYYTTKNTRVSETVEDDYQRTEGQPSDALWGLQSLGLFKDQADVDASPKSSYSTVQPGDIKYVDQNKDGVIDSKDFVVLGRWSAPWNIGINFTAKWKGFTLFALLTGNFGGMGVKNNSYYWVYGDGKYSEVVRGRWTPETAETATYPRLTTSTTAGNNFQTSDYWTYSTDRIDLGRVQLTYDLPKSLFNSNTVIKGMSVYFLGQSLLTIAGEREYMEMNVGSAPQTRSYNLGVKFDM